MSVTGELSDMLAAAQVRADLRSGRAREIRRRAGLTQAAVGRVVGVGQATVAAWETGRRVPGAAHAARLAELLWRLERLAREGS